MTTTPGPWQPDATRTRAASAVTSEMIGTAAMVISRMYSSEDPGEIQSGRAVVQALYPLIAAAERRATDTRWSDLRSELVRDIAIEQELGDDYSDMGDEHSEYTAYKHWGKAEALREVLARIDRADEQAKESGEEEDDWRFKWELAVRDDYRKRKSAGSQNRDFPEGDL